MQSGLITEDGEGITFRKDCENQQAVAMTLEDAGGGEVINRTGVLYLLDGKLIWTNNTTKLLVHAATEGEGET